MLANAPIPRMNITEIFKRRRICSFLTMRNGTIALIQSVITWKTDPK